MDKNFYTHKSNTGVEEFLEEFEKEEEVDKIDILDVTKPLTGSSPSVSRKPLPSKLQISRYYFLLAFEWVDCLDYVSNLFFYAFDPRIPLVPVVRSLQTGNNYTQHFPPGTFINADDFSSPQDLAKHLRNLASDAKAYSKMLLQKSQYVREAGVRHAWCQLCDLVHRATQDATIAARHEDMYAWLNEGGGCRESNSTSDDDSEDDDG
jgi:hypothetical protein